MVGRAEVVGKIAVDEAVGDWHDDHFHFDFSPAADLHIDLVPAVFVELQQFDEVADIIVEAVALDHLVAVDVVVEKVVLGFEAVAKIYFEAVGIEMGPDEIDRRWAPDNDFGTAVEIATAVVIQICLARREAVTGCLVADIAIAVAGIAIAVLVQICLVKREAAIVTGLAVGSDFVVLIELEIERAVRKLVLVQDNSGLEQPIEY